MLVQLNNKRPVSPHVFEVDTPTKFHYKMPINAISSIANRVTGTALTASAPPLSRICRLIPQHFKQKFTCRFHLSRSGVPVSASLNA